MTGLIGRHRVLVHGPGQGRSRATSRPRPRAVSATTQTGTVTDTTAPSAPTGLTAGTTTTTSVPLSWTASTDNVAVTGYDVYRGTTLVGTTTSTSYTVTGLSRRHRVLVHGPRQGRRRQRLVRRPRRLGHHAVGLVRPARCSVKYTANSWNTGFTASVKVTNTGTSALSSWSARLLLRQRPDGHPGLERRLVAVRHGRHGQERRMERHPRLPARPSTSGSTARTPARTTRPRPSRSTVQPAPPRDLAA